MAYNYFTHLRFVEFRTWLGYIPITPGIYLSGFKDQGLIRMPSFMKRLIRITLPEIYIETELTEHTAESVENMIREKKVFFVRGVTHTLSTFLKDYTVRTMGTFIVDLNRPLDDIGKSFEHSLRKQLNKTESHELHFVHVRDKSQLKTYYDLLKNFRDSQGFTTPPWWCIEKQWDLLGNEEPRGYEVFMITSSKGQPLAGMGIAINPDTKSFVEVAIGHSPEARTVPAMDTLRWNIIQWAHTQGLLFYDLAGVDPHADSGSKEEGIFRYKKKWSGTFHPVYFYERYFIANRWYYPIAYTILRWMRFIRT